MEVGFSEGESVGIEDGKKVGFSEGEEEGDSVGTELGLNDGDTDGGREGFIEGLFEGLYVGMKDGSFVVFDKSAITDHINCTNHIIDWENSKIIDREGDTKTRQIKEVIHIRRREEGAFSLSQIYDPVFAAKIGSGGNHRCSTKTDKCRTVPKKTTVGSRNSQH